MSDQNSQTQLSFEEDCLCEEIEQSFLRMAMKNKNYTLKQEVLDAREFRKNSKWKWEVVPKHS